jgi:hypothetical protein
MVRRVLRRRTQCQDHSHRDPAGGTDRGGSPPGSPQLRCWRCCGDRPAMAARPDPPVAFVRPPRDRLLGPARRARPVGLGQSRVEPRARPPRPVACRARTTDSIVGECGVGCVARCPNEPQDGLPWYRAVSAGYTANQRDVGTIAWICLLLTLAIGCVRLLAGHGQPARSRFAAERRPA